MPSRNKKLILLVDDDFEIADLYRDALEENFFACEIATTAIDGLEKARHLKPDLILLDLMLPGMSGFGFIRQLRKDPTCEDIPILILSVLNDDEIAEESLELGAAAYLTKAIHSRQLVSMVQEYA